MLRPVTALIMLLIAFAACSQNGSPIFPKIDSSAEAAASDELTSSSPDSASYVSSPVENPDLWAMFDMAFDPSTSEISVTPRTGQISERHYKVTYFLNPPMCSDCIEVSLKQSDISLGTFSFDVTLKNRTKLDGYDVRGVLLIPQSADLKLLNPDGYTNLFETAGYRFPAPFRCYASLMPDHRFTPNNILSVRYDLKTAPGPAPVHFTYYVSAGHPSPPGDVSEISGFRQYGQLLPGGGSATLRINVKDIQEDITGVVLRASQLGSGDIWLAKNGNYWDCSLSNSTAPPGIYVLKIDAYSPNPQNAVTSNYYRAVVFSNMAGFREQLLILVNQDRASNGLSSITIDPCLNTVAQAHAQDMADKNYFSHVNLDGWTPWQRMDYYGVKYGYAGENIAVGQDTPASVEQDWMNSSGHRANILGNKYKNIGIGIVPVPSGSAYYPGYYWVQLFTDGG